MNKFVALSVTLSWFAIIALGSLLPAGFKQALHTTGLLHTFFHVAAFATAAAILRQCRRTGWYSMLATIALGISIESGESLMPGAGLEWRDVLADAIGALVGTLGVTAVGRLLLKTAGDFEGI